jgi:Protein of unknown function (DUF3467)
MQEQPEDKNPPAKSNFERTADFATHYANNTQFEMSSWDLKLIFGQLDQGTVNAVVQQHTSITMAWVQAKLLSYFLQVNVDIYESENGKIKIPDAVLPHKPEPPSGELEKDPKAWARFELISEAHEKFLNSMETK